MYYYTREPFPVSSSEEAPRMNGNPTTKEHPKDNRFVGGGSKLLTADVCEELRNSEAVGAVIREMRDREAGICRQMASVDPAQIRAACQRRIAAYVPGSGLDELCSTGEGALDSHSFAQAVYNLPRTPANARQRRIARELARSLALVDGPGITVPESVDDFRRLWEEANDGEPRWSPDFPSSAFRTKTSAIITSVFEKKVVQVSTHHDNVQAELAQLGSFLADGTLAPEVRAACGFLSFEFTHPFGDGNGHTGRMLLLSMMQGRYSLPTLFCFAEELTLGRLKASHQFALIRSGEHSVADFCHAMLAYLSEAQEGAEELC